MVDVLVIGGGPAGLAAAIHARQYGYSVLVVEKNKVDVFKPCGDGLTEKSVTALSKLNIQTSDLLAVGANEILASVHIHNRYKKTISHMAGTCFTLRRHKLMGLLREKALSDGVEIQYSTPYSLQLLGKYIIDASGCQNKVSTGASFPVGVSAVIQGECRLSSDAWYFLHHKENDNGYCWAFPLSGSMWNVGVWQQYDCNNLRKNYNQFEQNDLKRCFSEIKYVRPIQGAKLGTIPALPHVCEGSVPCGDAAGLCDPFSGEGISFALMSGIAAIDRLKK